VKLQVKGLIFQGGCGLFEQVFRGCPQISAKLEIPLWTQSWHFWDWWESWRETAGMRYAGSRAEWMGLEKPKCLGRLLLTCFGFVVCCFGKQKQVRG